MTRLLRLFNKINDVSIKNKFILVYILCVLIPIVSINLIFLQKFSNNAKEREVENLKITMNRTQNDIKGIIEGCIVVANTLSTDRMLYEVLDKNYKDSSDFYDIYDRFLRDRVAMCLSITNRISKVCIYSENPTIQNGGDYFYVSDEYKASHWYKAATMSSEKFYLYSYREKKENTLDSYAQYLSLLRKMNEYPVSNTYGKIIKIDIDLDSIYSIFNSESKYLQMYLIDDMGRIICSTNHQSEQDLSDNFTNISSLNIKKELLNKSIILDSTIGDAKYIFGWRLIGISNKSHITDTIKKTRNSILLIALISTLLSTILIWFIFRSYNYRIQKLSKHMVKFKGEQFNLIEINEGKDEIGGLIASFNGMALKINTLINDVYKLDLQKKNLELERVRAELNFLQSQMNPHFLFNTLNAILIVSIKNQYEEVIDVIKYLSKTLRRLLSWKDDLVTVDEELEFTEMYLKIEKFRFRDKFQYNFIADDSVKKLMIPKMSIQPLVENACKHGIQAIKGEGLISVKVEFKDGKLNVIVEDNGNGIDSTDLDYIINNMLGEGNGGANIGLRNVYRRLKLYYGEDILFNIYSKSSVGTQVVFSIPGEKLLNE